MLACQHHIPVISNIITTLVYQPFSRTPVSRYQNVTIIDVTGAKMVVVVTIRAIRHVKLHSNSHHQQTKTQLFNKWIPFLSLTNSVTALKQGIMHYNHQHNNKNKLSYRKEITQKHSCHIEFLAIRNSCPYGHRHGEPCIKLSLHLI